MFIFDLWFLSWFKIFVTIAEKYVVLFLRVIIFVSSRPIVANCVSKYLSITTECATCYRLFHSFRSFKLCSCILKWKYAFYYSNDRSNFPELSYSSTTQFIWYSYLVPERESSVGPNCSECSMTWMKCYIIDCVNVLKSIGNAIRAMAFKCEIVLWILSVYVLNGNSPFYASQSKPYNSKWLIITT